MKKEQKTESKAVRLYRKLRFVLIPFVLVIMLFSAYRMLRIAAEFRKGEETYRAANDQFVIQRSDEKTDVSAENTPFEQRETAQTPPVNTASDPSDPTETEGPPATPQPEYAPIRVDFERAMAAYPECIGWIYIPDTDISLPVMQTKNNSFYLNHLPDGTENETGAIFADCENDPLLRDGNTILYGHRLKKGGMFSSLINYSEQSFFDAHDTFYYLTPDANYKVKAIAFAKVEAAEESYEYYRDTEELHTYLKQVKKHAKSTGLFDTDSVEHILTLSTCTTGRDKRIVLIGVPEQIGSD